MRSGNGFWTAVSLLLVFCLQVDSKPDNNVNPYWQEFLGIGAPLFPQLADDTAVCYKFFQTLSHTDCTPYVSRTLPVTVHNCLRQSASGLLVLQRTDSHGLHASELLGSAVYRLRAIGPDGLWLLEVTYCRPDLAMAAFTFRSPGRYAIEVLMLYTSFSFSQPNTSKTAESPWAGFLTLDVQASAGQYTNRIVTQSWSPDPDESVLVGISQATRAADSTSSAAAAQKGQGEEAEPGLAQLPLCPDTGPQPGRWLFHRWPVPAAAPLLQTCVWSHPAADCGSPRRRAMRLDARPAGLYWQPAGCHLRPVAGLIAARSLITATAPGSSDLAVAVTSASSSGSIPQPQPELLGQAAAAAAAAGGNVSSSATRQLHETQSRQGRQPLNQVRQRGLEPASGPTPPTDPGSCLPPRRRVCFVGDSHLRYLHNSLILWQSGYELAVDNSVKEMLHSDNSAYFRMLWGHDWPQATSDDPNGIDPLAANCTDVFANFGQWPASYRSGPAPHPAVSYLRQLLHVRRHLLRLRRVHGVRVYWVTTCMSSLKVRLEVLGVDWRTDPLLLLYNRIAADVMAGTWAGLAEGEEEEGQESVVGEAGTAGGGAGPAGVGRARAILAPTAAAEPALGARLTLRKTQGVVEGEEGSGGYGRGGERGRGGLLRVVREGGEQQGIHRGGKSRPGPSGRKAEAGSLRGSRRVQRQHSSSNAVDGTSKMTGHAAARVVGRSTRSSRQLRRLLQEWLRGGNGDGHGRGHDTGSSWSSSSSSEVQEQEQGQGASERQAPRGAAEAVPLIDTWSATRVLHDTTWDGVHYDNMAAVGLLQLRAVLHALCSEAVLAELRAAANATSDPGR